MAGTRCTVRCASTQQAPARGPCQAVAAKFTRLSAACARCPLPPLAVCIVVVVARLWRRRDTDCCCAVTFDRGLCITTSSDPT